MTNFHKRKDFSTFETELQDSLLSNINYNGTNKEKKKKKKTRAGIFKSMGGIIPGRHFPGGFTRMEFDY